MLVPTTWNLPTCSRGLTGAPWQIAEMVVRAYDPCVSCATHMIVVDKENRLVAQKLIRMKGMEALYPEIVVAAKKGNPALRIKYEESLRSLRSRR